MPLTRRPLVACFTLVLVAGCGASQSYDDGARSAVGDTRAAVQTYNAAPTSSLSAAGAACFLARSQIQGAGTVLLHGSPPPQRRQLASMLKRAYLLMERGFRDCSAASATLNYPLMVAAYHEIAAANSALEQASQVDR